jgi:3-hydroxyacyl-CoA dehydrogenase
VNSIMAVRLEITNGVAVATIDNPPVNVIGQAVRAGLNDAIGQVEAAGAHRFIITGEGRNFAAGADAKEFDAPPREPHLNDVLSRLSALTCPTIAALKGVVLGGGLEIALACRYRIASPDAKLGLPEVTLGIVPGAGGTQRLPRIVGMKAALDLISQGRSVDAAKGKSLGLVDAVSDEPMMLALSIDNAVLSNTTPTDLRPSPVPDEQAVALAVAHSKRRAPGQVAVESAISLVAMSSSQELAVGLAREREVFLQLRSSDEARALRYVFFAERSATARSMSLGSSGIRLESAVVVGGGNMGAGIAYSIASSGIAVTVAEMDGPGRNRAEANVQRLVEQGVTRGSVTTEQKEQILDRIAFVSDLKELPKADLLVEAVFEDMALKKKIFQAVENVLPETTIIASNTSYLDINELSDAVQTPARFLGLHFFSPAHVMRLLEIVRGDKTSASTLAFAFEFARQLGKLPVVAGVCDGFIGNRILTRYRNAADALLLEGATPTEIDKAMEQFGMAMGPYKAQDMSGLDIAYASRQRRTAAELQMPNANPVADTLVEKLNRLGRKTNGGWYDYDAGGNPAPSPVVEACIFQASEDAGLKRRPIEAHDIVERLILAMILEACGILDEGIAACPQDVDVVMVHGYGFPRWRGGLMYYADKLTPQHLLDVLTRFQQANSASWTIPPLLRRLVDGRLPFDSLNPAR